MNDDMILLADNGRTDWKIVIPKQAIASERHAAEELKHFLKEISQASFPIVEDDLPKQDKLIILGLKNRLLEPALSSDQESDLGREGFIMRANANTVVIAGGQPRGTLYGVYSFLEKKLGCRWFYRGVSSIPKRSCLWISHYDEMQKPIFEYRDPYFRGSIDPDWHARNKSNSDFVDLENIHGKKVKYAYFVHSFNRLMPVDVYFSEHPEYYSEIDGQRISDRTQLCLTNPEVLKICTERVRDLLRDDPDVSIVSVSQNDWINPCQCEKCSKIDDMEGSHSGSLIHFVNAIAEAIEQEFPEVAIDTLAYQYTRKPPKHVRPRDNVIIRLCSIECCFSHPLETCTELGSFRKKDWASSSFKDDLIAWSKICKRLHIWDYVTNFANYTQPFPNFHVLQKNIQFFARNHVTGIFEEGNASRGESCEFDQLRQYVLAKLLWNPDEDLDLLVNEFLNAYYGASAALIRKYFDLAEAQVDREHVHMGIYDPPDSDYFDHEFVAGGLAIFEEAKRVADNEEILRRVITAELPVRYLKIQNMPSDNPDRKTLIDQFLVDVKAAGIDEIRESRPLDISADLLYKGVIQRPNA